MAGYLQRMWLLGFSLAAALELRQLPEGTTILVEERPDAQVLALHLIHPAGAARDPQGRSGLAHLVEHARFHGSAEGYDTQLAQLGGWGNAWVDHDLAAYWARVPAEAGLALLDLERRRLQGWQAPTDLAPLLRTLEAELAWREVDPLLRQFWPSDHAYARPVMGTELEGIRPEELQDFVAAHYRPEQARLVLVGGLSPALRSFLDRLPMGQKSASIPALPSPALNSLRSGDRRIWPVPPTEVALRPGLALLAEVQRLHGSEAIVWIGQEGGLFSVEGPFSRGLRRDWSQALRRLERQVEEEHDDPVRQAQALNLCWSWGTDCNPQLLSGFSSPQWAGHLSRALRRQEWPVAPTLDDPPPPPQTAANPAVPAVGPGEQIYVQPEQSGRTVVELSLLCGWDCRTLPTSYLENLWELRSAALRRRLGGSRVELGCDPQRCRVWVDSLAEELAPTLLTVYDWLQNTPVGVDVEGPDAQEAAIAAVVGRPVEGGGFISPRRGAAELARLREAPVVVVAVGATQGLEEGLRPWRSPRTDGEYKKPSMPPLFVTEPGEEAPEGRVSLLWAAPSPAAPERSAWEVAFLSITGSPASALERRLREELGWVYGFALSEEIGPHGSYMRLDLDVPVERQSALRSEVEAILARSRPAGWERALWEARQSDPEFATRAAAMSRRALWGLSPGAPALPSPAEVERAFSSLPSPMWVIGGQLSPSGVGRAWPARSSPTGDPA